MLGSVPDFITIGETLGAWTDNLHRSVFNDTIGGWPNSRGDREQGCARQNQGREDAARRKTEAARESWLSLCVHAAVKKTIVRLSSNTHVARHHRTGKPLSGQMLDMDIAGIAECARRGGGLGNQRTPMRYSPGTL